MAKCLQSEVSFIARCLLREVSLLPNIFEVSCKCLHWEVFLWRNVLSFTHQWNLEEFEKMMKFEEI